MSRREFLKITGLVTASSLALIAGSYLVFDESRDPVIERVVIPIQGLHPALEGFSIVQLSDIHLLPFTRASLVKKTIAMVNNLNPDLIVLTGDYIWQGREGIYELPPLLAGLNARFGVYSVMGNHDYWLDIQALRTEFARNRLPVLDNEGVPIVNGKGAFYLAGLDDGWSGQPDFRKAIAGATGSVPIVLLLHEPDLVDQTSLNERIALQLSGHTHGGQVLLKGENPPIKPYLGKKYVKGLYRVRNTWQYTSRGIGVISVPLRINCPPEITHLTLVT